MKDDHESGEFQHAGEEPARLGVVLDDRYELREEIGRGGMAVVYKAWHRGLERFVAVKVLHPKFGMDQHHLLQMRNEARVIAELKHPNIVDVYAFGATEGSPYVVMELLDGKPLSYVIAAGPIAIRRCVNIMLQVADALDYAHGKGIVHRDLKPSNIMVEHSDAGDKVRILDFGLARQAAEESETLTRVVGTAAYMSPEQSCGKRPNALSDLYSTGCIFYEMLTGMQPFRGENSIDIMRKQLMEEAPAMVPLRPDLPRSVVDLTARLMAKDPEGRYQSAADMSSDLRRILSFLDGAAEEPHLARAPSKAAARPVWPTFAVPGVVIVALLLVALNWSQLSGLFRADNTDQQLQVLIDDVDSSHHNRRPEEFAVFCHQLDQQALADQSVSSELRRARAHQYYGRCLAHFNQMLEAARELDKAAEIAKPLRRKDTELVYSELQYEAANQYSVLDDHNQALAVLVKMAEGLQDRSRTENWWILFNQCYAKGIEELWASRRFAEASEMSVRYGDLVKGKKQEHDARAFHMWSLWCDAKMKVDADLHNKNIALGRRYLPSWPEDDSRVRAEIAMAGSLAGTGHTQESAKLCKEILRKFPREPTALRQSMRVNLAEIQDFLRLRDDEIANLSTTIELERQFEAPNLRLIQHLTRLRGEALRARDNKE